MAAKEDGTWHMGRPDTEAIGLWSDSDDNSQTPSLSYTRSDATSGSPVATGSTLSSKLADTEDSEDELEKLLPPETTEPYPHELQDGLDYMLRHVEYGLDFHKFTQTCRRFRNPCMLVNFIKKGSIDEYGTNFPPEVFDPNKFRKESYKSIWLHTEKERKVQDTLEKAMEKARQKAQALAVEKSGEASIEKTNKENSEPSCSRNARQPKSMKRK